MLLPVGRFVECNEYGGVPNGHQWRQRPAASRVLLTLSLEGGETDVALTDGGGPCANAPVTGTVVSIERLMRTQTHRISTMVQDLRRVEAR